jgi:formylmethanofuran dehydrogenase subunit E
VTARIVSVEERTAIDALMHPNGRCRCAGEGHCDWCARTAEKLATEVEPVDVQVSVEGDVDFERIEALLGALGFSVQRIGQPTDTPARGTTERPCEYCGNATTGSTVDYKGFMRCNACGEPSP